MRRACSRSRRAPRRRPPTRSASRSARSPRAWCSGAAPTTPRCWSSRRATGASTSSKVGAIVGAARPRRCRLRQGRAPASRSAASRRSAHATPPVTLIDRELFRFDEIWAAAGHPNGVFRLSPDELVRLTGAPVARRRAGADADGRRASPSPCIDVCRMDARSGWCEGCLRTLDEIAAWSTLDDAREARGAGAARATPSASRPSGRTRPRAARARAHDLR